MHKHLIFTGVSPNPPKDPKYIEQVLLDLVEVAKMEVFMPPQAKYCEDPHNAGVTGTVVITTSHASVHVWDYGLVQADLYSCKDFEADQVAAFLAETLGCTEYDTLVIDRALSPRLKGLLKEYILEVA
jgi:S-adenosylmethionine/arginine decarboxylase-like enzyme